MDKVNVLLEQLIDAHGLESILDRLAAIAEEKAEHVVQAYSDDILAKRWRSAGAACSSASLNCAKHLSPTGTYVARRSVRLAQKGVDHEQK